MAVLKVEHHDSPTVQALRFIGAYWPILVPALFLIRFLYYRYASPLRHYPGPFLASGSRAWKVISTYRGKTEADHINLHKKYGNTTLPNHRHSSTDTAIKAPSSASPRTNSPSPPPTRPKKSSPPAKASPKPTSTASSPHPRIQTSSPRPAKPCTRSRSAMPRIRTQWRACRVSVAILKTRRGC